MLSDSSRAQRFAPEPLTMLVYRSLLAIVPLAIGLAPATTALAQGESGAASSLSDSAPTTLEDPPLPLVPQQARSELQEERMQAGAHYATGRTLFHRGDLAGALRQYQRAWRWDPTATDILGDIVALAFSVERPDEAVRYALLAAQVRDSEALMLRRLALYVTEEGDRSQAVQLYRRWLAHPDTKLSRDELDKLLVQLEVGRLEFLNDNPRAASKALAEFQAALRQAGAESSLGKQVRSALGDDLNATWELCAMAHLEAAAYDLAAEALDQIDLPLEQTGRLGFLKARVALERGEPTSAWEHLRSYLSAGFVEDGSEPYALLGEVLKQLNQPDATLLELSKLQQRDPRNPALTVALASELEQRNELPAAVELYRSVAFAPDEVPESLLAAAAARLLRLYASQGEAESIWELLSRSADKLSDPGELSLGLLELAAHPALIDQILDLDQASTEGRSAAQAMTMAALLMEAQRYDDVQPYFERAIAAEPQRKLELSLSAGLALIAADQYSAAADTLRQAMDEAEPTLEAPLIRYYLSLALEMAGETDEALRIARTLAEKSPEDVQFATHMPWILYHANRHEEAIAAYEEVLAKFDDRRESEVRAELRDVRSALSHLAVMSGDLAAGEEWLAQILDEFPEDVGARNDLGYLWADANKHLRRARWMIEEAVAAEPDNAAYRDSLGWVLHRQGEHAEATRELEKAVELSGDEDAADAVILDHLGDAYLELGDTAKAVHFWRLALKGLAESEPQTAAATEEKIQQHDPGE